MYCMQCFVLIEIVTVKGQGNTCSHRLRLVAIGYGYVTGCHDNGSVGLHLCAKLNDHKYTQCFMLVVKG